MNEPREQEKENGGGLSPESTIEELFNFIAVEEGVNVLPITVKQAPHDSRFLIAIQGHHETASTIMAQIAALVADLHDREAQATAMESDGEKGQIIHHGDRPRIVTR